MQLGLLVCDSLEADALLVCIEIFFSKILDSYESSGVSWTMQLP